MTIDNILALLEASGRTQKELADYIGVAKSRITDWKQGRMHSYTKYLPAIAEFFGVSYDTLLGDPPPRIAEHILRVPVYGRVAAGIPMEAIEDIEDYEELNTAHYPIGDYMALRIHGHSMEPRMTEGDIVIVRRQSDADTGDTVVVLVGTGEADCEATCKKLKKTPDGILLLSTNPAFEPIFYSNREIVELPVSILGRVVELRAKY